MPVFEVASPYGVTLEVEGDRPPTDDELKSMFDAVAVKRPPATTPEDQRLASFVRAQEQLNATPDTRLVRGDEINPAAEGRPEILKQAWEAANAPIFGAIPRIETSGKSVIPSVAAAAVNTAVGVANFLQTPAGVATLPVAMVPGGPIALGAAFAPGLAAEAGKGMGEASVTGNIQQGTEAALQLALAAGMQKPAFSAVANKVVPARALAKAIGEAPLKGAPPIDAAAIEASRLPDRPPAVPPVPTAAETARLIDQAIKERQTGLVVPGQLPALEQLKRQFQDVIVPASEVTGGRVADRPGGGPAIGGKISFAAEAEAGAVPSARQSAVEPTSRPTGSTSEPTSSPTPAAAASASTVAGVSETPRPGTPSAATGSTVGGQPTVPAADITARLESLKFKDVGGGVGANPFPEIAKAVWDTGIDLSIAAIKAGRKIGEAIEVAISHLRKNAKGFDETKVRSYLTDLLTKENVSVPDTSVGPVKMRKSSARATQSPDIPESIQEAIKTDPASFYKQQPEPTVEQAVSRLSDVELATMPVASNLYVASRLELATRLFRSGQMQEGYGVFKELATQGTSFGQNINQFKRLIGSMPEHIAFVVNETLKEAGKDPLTKAQESSIIDLSRQSKAADVALDKSTSDWMRDPSDANAKAAEAALDLANQKAVELQRGVSRFQPRGTAQVLKSILQGNLLTPISEVANLVGNASFLPFRATARGTAALLDIVESAIFKTPREVSVQPVAGTAEAAKGAGRGMAMVPDILRQGSGDTIKGETRAGLHPVRAWINQFAKNPEMPTVGGKLTLTDRINLALEGTFGVPAEVMLRGLAAGDMPFREAARARVVAEKLKLNKVPREQWSFAQKFPELFFDTKEMSDIHSGTMQAIFQRDSQTLNHVTNWIKGKGDAFDLFVATIAPYKLTPWNIIGEIMSYNPLIAMARATADSVKHNSRSAKLNAGKMVVGSMLTATGWWLYKQGLMAPSLDERDEAQKARLLANEVLPPNHINLSGLDRKLKGGDPSFQPGDKTADVFRAGGLAGAMFYMTANIGREFERKPEVADSDIWMSLITQSSLEQARFGLNQSFLSGVEGLLTAVKDGNADNYVSRWAGTALAIPLPNTLNTINRTMRDYKVDMKADTLRGRVENLLKVRVGMDEYLPLKRGLWGEPLRETPEGQNSIIYQFFDITKGKQVSDDPVPLELYRLWRSTANNEVIPSIPMRSLTVDKQTYVLNPKQYERMAELVGGRRKQIADAMVINPNFHRLPDEQKIDLLKRAYDAGQKAGRTEFLRESIGQLSPKAERSGF